MKKVEAQNVKLKTRTGNQDLTSLEVVGNSDLLLKGSFWFGCWFATIFPEAGIVHSFAFAKGLYKAATGQLEPSQADPDNS